MEEAFLKPKIDSLSVELHKNNKDFVYFYPLCIEEILLSFKDLYNVQYKNNELVKIISQSFNKNVIYYNYDNNLYHIPLLDISVSNMEIELAKRLKELTRNTLFVYKNKKISGCYLVNCCDDNYAFVKDIDKINNIVHTTDMLTSIKSGINCNINNNVKIRYLYYKNYTILKNLYLAVDSLLNGTKISDDLLYILRS